MADARIVDDLSSMQFALSVARRQPMHEGHAAALQHLLDQGCQLVVVNGSCNTAHRADGRRDVYFDPFRNPLTLGQQRQQLLERFPHLYDKKRFQQEGAPADVHAPNMLLLEIPDTDTWPEWYANFTEKLQKQLPEFSGLPYSQALVKTALCFNGKPGDKVEEITIPTKGEPTTFRDVFAKDLFVHYGVNVWHFPTYDTAFTGHTATALRNKPLGYLPDGTIEPAGLCAPEYVAGIATQARHSNPNRDLLDNARIPLTTFDLTLARLYKEAGITTASIFARLPDPTHPTLEALNAAAKDVLQEWKSSRAVKAPRTAPVIGLVGMSGAGKSTASTWLKNRHGAVCFEADRVIDDLVKQHGEAIPMLRALFPEAIVDNALDRNALRVLMQDPVTQHAYVDLIMPLVQKRLGTFREQFKNTTILLDIPLLLDGPIADICDTLLMVHAPEQLRAERVVQRAYERMPEREPNLDLEKVKGAFAASNRWFGAEEKMLGQARERGFSEGAREGKALFTIRNDGSTQQLLDQLIPLSNYIAEKHTAITAGRQA